MKHDDYFYNCSREYINSIEPSLYEEITAVISRLPKRAVQSQINNDIFWLLTNKQWSFDTLSGISSNLPVELNIETKSRLSIQKSNKRSLCVTPETLDASWHCDFAKLFYGTLVQLEAQFGKVESMFKDFCGFKIACYETRLALGIEIVLCNPYNYFAHRRNAIGGMAYFDIAKNTLPAIGLECPVWLIGIKE